MWKIKVRFEAIIFIGCILVGSIVFPLGVFLPSKRLDDIMIVDKCLKAGNNLFDCFKKSVFEGAIFGAFVGLILIWRFKRGKPIFF